MLTLCELRVDRVHIFHKISTYRPMLDISINGNTVFLGFKSGDTELFYITNIEDS